MRQENIDWRRKEKRSSLFGFLLFCLLQACCVAGFLALTWIPGLPLWAQTMFCILAAFCGLLVFPALAALRIRWKEIDRLYSVHIFKEETTMLLVNIDYIPGKELEVLGLVKGTVVQSKNFGKDFMAGMKTLVGGEITGYTEMLNEARQIAMKRMVDEAEGLGADAVVNIRYGSSAVMQGAAEVIAYGTAVRFK